MMSKTVVTTEKITHLTKTRRYGINGSGQVLEIPSTEKDCTARNKERNVHAKERNQ